MTMPTRRSRTPNGIAACDEDPDELMDDLESRIDALISGHFSESISSDSEGRWLTFSFELKDGRTWGKALLREGHPARTENGDLTWPAWRPRD